MNISTMIFGAFTIALVLLNGYQFLVQRTAIRISKGLFVMSSNVIEKTREIQSSGKDIEIVEAHLMDIHTLIGVLLSSLRTGEKMELGSFLYTHQQGPPDPLAEDGEETSIVQSVQGIVRHLLQDHGEWEINDIVEAALDRFAEKMPSMEQKSARRLVETVVKRNCILGVKWDEEMGVGKMAEVLGCI